ncbi:hypothetical protein D6D22_05720 [Aureobasidium pullulans]|uniref:Uncharacterized protein n=1 Tax=Aureobasidium pullulans TaxID=5580 RepID=A0A4S8XS62_AURPU|nr:hypothetical protein D6D22_05720 [Aureobasidium pullulans]
MMHGQDFTIIDQSSRAIHEYQLTTAPMKPSDENSRIPHTAERATTSIRTSPCTVDNAIPLEHLPKTLKSDTYIFFAALYLPTFLWILVLNPRITIQKSLEELFMDVVIWG